MLRHHHLTRIHDLEKELAIAIRLLAEDFPGQPYCGDQSGILFQFDFFNTQILQPMSITKLIGAFSGSLVFKNAEGQILDLSKVTNLALVADNAAVGTVTLDPSTGNFSGTGIAAGTLTLTATSTNDAGNTITGTTQITFHADTTVTEIDVNVN